MRAILKTLTGIVVMLVVSLVLLEILMQLALMSLPQPILVNMPQYPLRYGIQFDTPHGAREYPANAEETVQITQNSGDLFALTCLSPLDAPESEPYTVQYTRDEHGFRNTAGWSEHDDPVDLVIVGDSFTAAEAIQRPYWDGLSDSQLVFGLPGSGTLEQLRLLEAYGLPRQPQTVVIAYFGGNDLADSARFSAAQQAGLNLHEYGNQNRRPWEYLATFQTVMLLRQAFASDDAGDCPFPVMTTTDVPLAVYPPFLEFGTVAPDELGGSAWFTQTAEAIAATASEAPRLIVVYIPHKAEVYWSLLDEAERMSIAATLTAQTISDDGLAPVDDLSAGEINARFNANMDAQRTLLAEHATANGYNFYDLTPDLRAAAVDGAALYFFGDTHWNQAGHDLVRDLLAAYLADF